MPVAARRRSISAAISAREIGFGLALEVFDAIIACAFVPDALFHILQVGIGMKHEEVALRRARRVMATANRRPKISDAAKRVRAPPQRRPQ